LKSAFKLRESDLEIKEERENKKKKKVIGSKPEVCWPHTQSRDRGVTEMISMPLWKPSLTTKHSFMLEVI
jgi:hypothetical protein